MTDTETFQKWREASNRVIEAQMRRIIPASAEGRYEIIRVECAKVVNERTED